MWPNPFDREDLQKILYRWIVAPRLDQPGDGQNDPSDYPTAQGPEETRTLVNLYMIDQLLEMGGQPMALKVVNQFLHDVRSIVEELQIAIATANAGSLHRTAHGLKGIMLEHGGRRTRRSGSHLGTARSSGGFLWVKRFLRSIA